MAQDQRNFPNLDEWMRYQEDISEPPNFHATTHVLTRSPYTDSMHCQQEFGITLCSLTLEDVVTNTNALQALTMGSLLRLSLQTFLQVIVQATMRGKMTFRGTQVKIRFVCRIKLRSYFLVTQVYTTSLRG